MQLMRDSLFKIPVYGILGVYGLLPGSYKYITIGVIEITCLLVIAQLNINNFAQFLLNFRVVNRAGYLNTVSQVAFHPIG